jgi:hypothetical protein
LRFGKSKFLQKMKKLAYAKLPSAGLGNLLFVWARACIFAKINQCPLYTKGWSQLHIKTVLRGEKSYRFYGRYFIKNDLLTDFNHSINSIIFEKSYNINPTLKVNPEKNTVYIFDQVPHWGNSFEYIREERDFIKKSLFDMLTQRIKVELNRHLHPQIAIHIRRGDFANLPAGVEFKTVGSVKTPLDYFVKIISAIRKYVNNTVEVQVFSDGTAEELSPVLQLENVKLVETKYDITDLLLMSKAKVLITSAGSSFSYWAGFLSEATVIIHYDHIHAPHRDKLTNERLYEGAIIGEDLDNWSELLKQNLDFFFS